MASTKPHDISPTSPPNIRTPKLRYRNSAHHVEPFDTADRDSSKATASINNTSNTCSYLDASVESSTSPNPIPAASRSASISAASLVPPTVEPKPRKRQSFFSSLFAVKEPSAQALADYERQLSEQGTLKNGRIGVPGMPGVSSAKLPASVPKVNSKWDGTPQSARVKDRKKDQDIRRLMSLFDGANRSGSSGKISGTSSLRMTETRDIHSRGTLSGSSVYSAQSGGSGNRLADLYGWEVRDFAANNSSRNVSMDRSRPNTSRSPSSQNSRLFSTPNLAAEVMEPPQIPTTYFDKSPSSTSSSLSPPTFSHSSASTPYDSSPTTPEGPTPSLNIASAQSDKTLCEPLEGSGDGNYKKAEEASTFTNKVITRSSGVDILPPPKPRLRQALNPQVTSEGQTQTTAANRPPRSIIKESAARRSPLPSQGLTPPRSIDNASGTAHESFPKLRLSSSRDDTSSRSADFPGAAANNRSNGITTPTPEEGGQSLRRKSRMSLFKHSHRS